jgi:predicted  nucleic acid-binding Zn-ribbon protein
MINRLSTLYAMQLIDDQLDELEELRGDLPLRVNSLNGKIKEIQDQIDEKDNVKKNSLKQRKTNENEIERLNENLKKFKAQLFQVRNNKEYDALTKEIDHSEAEIKRLENDNMEMELRDEKLKFEIDELTPKIEELHNQLKENEVELKKIIKENELEEVKLKDKREQIVLKVRKPDYNVYLRIRKALRGKAIVIVNRSACSGCHNVVPPQRQIEVRQNRRIYTCESCGRIIVSSEVAQEAGKLI